MVMRTLRTAQTSGRLFLLAMFLYGGPAAFGIKMEPGPAYLTDSHGASGMAQAFMELSRIDPRYERYAKGALDWLVAVARRDAEGRVEWPRSTSAPPGHPNRQVVIPGMCHTIRTLFAGYERFGDERYREAALGGVRMFIERFAAKRRTPLGVMYAWSHVYRPGDRSPGLLAGHSHGLGNLLDVLLDGYEARPDPATARHIEQAVRGILVNLRQRGVRRRVNGKQMIFWPSRKNPRVVETGYCYGQAGLVLPLLRAAGVFPDMKLDDGATPLGLANASLRYLASVAVRKGGGYVWPYMRHTRTSRNIGYGSGTGGIGWAFLRGYEVNRGRDPEFAGECFRFARGAALYAVGLVEKNKKRGALRSPGGDAGFGACGGASGGVHFLSLFADAVREREPALARRIDAAVRTIAGMVIASAVTFKDGSMAIPDRTHFRRINIALDYGQGGVALVLAGTGLHLHDKRILDAACRFGDYIAAQAVPDRGGLKFPQFQPLPDLAARRGR